MALGRVATPRCWEMARFCKVDANRYDVGYDVGRGVEGELNMVWDGKRYQASK